MVQRIPHYKDEHTFREKTGRDINGERIQKKYPPPGTRSGPAIKIPRPAKDVDQYEPPAPEKHPVKEKVKSAVKKGGAAVKRGVEYAAPKIKRAAVNVARNANRSAGRDTGLMNIQPPRDMFSFQAPSFMYGPMVPEPEPAPRRRRRKPIKKSAPRRQAQGPGWQEIGGVPDSVKRWMM